MQPLLDTNANTKQGMDRLLPSDAKEAYIKSQPLGRLGSVRDIADATVYLFANTGSYVSGQVLVGMSPHDSKMNQLM